MTNAMDIGISTERRQQIAERIRALGIAAPFGDSTLNGLASIQEAPSVPDAMDMVQQLRRTMKQWLERREAFSRSLMQPATSRARTC